MVFVKKNG